MSECYANTCTAGQSPVMLRVSSGVSFQRGTAKNAWACLLPAMARRSRRYQPPKRDLVLHPTKQATVSRRGYRRSQFIETFLRYLPNDPKDGSPSRTRISVFGQTKRNGILAVPPPPNPRGASGGRILAQNMISVFRPAKTARDARIAQPR
jgi:hypothetical protein